MSFIFLRNRVTGGAAFTPASLFASGEEGAWYEPSPTTCFTDTAGTTAAGVGDAVARINDSSGNGNHATQGTAAARPLLQQTAGGLYYLEFDGTDDYLIVPSASISGAAAFDFYSAWESDDVTATTMLFAALSSATQFVRPTYTQTSFFSVRFGAGSSTSSVSSAISSATPYVSGSRFTQNAAYSGRLNGVSVGEITSGFGAGALLSGVNPFLGAESNSGSPRFYWNGKFFGAVAIQRNVTAQEISDTETYLAAKSGVTL